MADNNQPIEWYLARDGQQHGPVTDAELKKIIELGYLRPTDLVWRQGMPDWGVAEAVLGMRPIAAVATPAPAPTTPTERPADTSHPNQAGMAHIKPAPARPARSDPATGDGRSADRPQASQQRRFPWRALAAAVVIAIVAASGIGLYRTGKLAELPFLAAPATSEDVPVVSRPQDAVRETTSSIASADAASLPQPIEQRLQTSPLWKVLQHNFPDWYSERVAEVAKLSSESKSQREIDAALTRSIVELRRRHQNDALAAGPEKLKAMAQTFVESLAQLSRISTSACYGYISQGEASPAVAELTAPEQRAAIDAQLTTIFDAIAEGRQSPAQRQPPQRQDYDVLSKELGQRGWSAADLQLFTDARALSRAAPEKVCQMVQDWFAAQLAVPDEAVKIRLLGEALKPVVAG
jgi:hypothetical protein